MIHLFTFSNLSNNVEINFDFRHHSMIHVSVMLTIHHYKEVYSWHMLIVKYNGIVFSPWGTWRDLNPCKFSGHLPSFRAPEFLVHLNYFLKVLVLIYAYLYSGLFSVFSEELGSELHSHSATPCSPILSAIHPIFLLRETISTKGVFAAHRKYQGN